MPDKEAIRRELKARRDALTAAEVTEKSLKVQERLIRSQILSIPRVVALYSPIRNEVRTALLCDFLAGRRLLFPRLTPHLMPQLTEDRLEFVEANSETRFSAGRFGILEPQGGETVPVGSVDLFIVPGVAFDEQGFRIGFGRGWYDRALQGSKGAKVGLAYDFQVLSQVPHSPGDLRLDWICTESQMVVCTRS